MNVAQLLVEHGANIDATSKVAGILYLSFACNLHTKTPNLLPTFCLVPTVFTDSSACCNIRGVHRDCRVFGRARRTAPTHHKQRAELSRQQPKLQPRQSRARQAAGFLTWPALVLAKARPVLQPHATADRRPRHAHKRSHLHHLAIVYKLPSSVHDSAFLPAVTRQKDESSGYAMISCSGAVFECDRLLAFCYFAWWNIDITIKCNNNNRNTVFSLLWNRLSGSVERVKLR